MMNTRVNRLRILIACTLIAGLLAACQPPPASPTAGVQPTLTASIPTLEPTLGAAEIRATIINALWMLDKQPNRMESTTVPTGGQASTTVIEYIPKDRKHIVTSDAELIVAGGKVYIKTSGRGVWQEEPQVPAATYLGDGNVSDKTIDPTIGSPTFVRSDALDGKPMLVFSYASTTHSGDIELHSQTELWVGKADSLPYKMIIDGDILGMATDSITGTTKSVAVKALTTVLIVFDPSIQIEPPL